MEENKIITECEECGKKVRVRVGAAKWKCPVCGKINIVRALEEEHEEEHEEKPKKVNVDVEQENDDDNDFDNESFWPDNDEDDENDAMDQEDVTKKSAPQKPVKKESVKKSAAKSKSAPVKKVSHNQVAISGDDTAYSFLAMFFAASSIWAGPLAWILGFIFNRMDISRKSEPSEQNNAARICLMIAPICFVIVVFLIVFVYKYLIRLI